MPRDVARNALYNGQINLWVEDDLTRAYLSALWDDSAVKFLVGGGHDGVNAILRDAELAKFANVFGISDRDFRPSNRTNWTNPAKTFRNFILPVHEIENYLLDASALHASRYHNRRFEVAAFEGRMLSKAKNLCWWAACRATIAELRQRFREPFVPDPSQSVVDEVTARDHICKSPWFEKLATEAGQSTEADIVTLLADSHSRVNRGLADGNWRTDFAGKEILRDVAGWMCDRTAMPKFPSPHTEFFSDLAKEIAVWQRSKYVVPADLIELLDSLERRIAL